MNGKVKPWVISIIGGIISGFIVLYLWEFWKVKEAKLQIITFLVDWFPLCMGVLGFLIILLIISLLHNQFFSRRSRVRVIRNPQGYQYLVEGNGCFHIPDPATFNYLGSFFGFSWPDSELMLPEEISRRFTVGRALPSINPYCPKIEEQPKADK